jgi:hypothetical protein
MHCVRVYDAVVVVRFYLYLTIAIDMTDEVVVRATTNATGTSQTILQLA